MPLAWAHAEFVKLLVSRQLGRPFDRPRAVWQRYRGAAADARNTHSGGRTRRSARSRPARGWRSRCPTRRSCIGAVTAGRRSRTRRRVDSGLGFHVAVLATAALPAGSRIDFTWRRRGWRRLGRARRHGADRLGAVQGRSVSGTANKGNSLRQGFSLPSGGGTCRLSLFMSETWGPSGRFPGVGRGNSADLNRERPAPNRELKTPSKELKKRIAPLLWV